LMILVVKFTLRKQHIEKFSFQIRVFLEKTINYTLQPFELD